MDRSLQHGREGRFHTIGTGDMSTTEAEKKRDEFMRTLNGSQEPDSDGTRPLKLKLREFIEQQYLLCCRKKWKASTAGTSEDRIRDHIINDIADRTMSEFTLTSLQSLLEGKADVGLSFSVVDHLRWDLSAIFDVAIGEKAIETSTAARIYTPKACTEGTDTGHVGGGRADNDRCCGFLCSGSCAPRDFLTDDEIDVAGQLLLHLAIFPGLRPGEMLVLQRRHVALDCSSVIVEHRVYRWVIDVPKTNPSAREVAIPPRTAELLLEWMDSSVDPEPDA